MSQTLVKFTHDVTIAQLCTMELNHASTSLYKRHSTSTTRTHTTILGMDTDCVFLATACNIEWTPLNLY